MMRLLFAFAAILPAFAQPSSVQERIRAVESNLTLPVAVKGRPIPRFTIDQRMQALHVRGIGIAVIQNYEVEWAKGYGLADLETYGSFLIFRRGAACGQRASAKVGDPALGAICTGLDR